MPKIINYGNKNETLIDTGNYLVLFSYETPVAAYDKLDLRYIKTEKFFSVTTSKHINKFIDNYPKVAANETKVVPQEWFDYFLK